MKYKRLLLIPVALLALLSVNAVKRDFALVRDTEILISILRTLDANYVDSLSSSQILKDATQGISESLDPYTTYLSEEDMEAFDIMTTGKYGGIGSVIRLSGDYVKIAQPYKGSPSDKSGLIIGDKIIEIDGKSAKDLNTKEVSDQLKGQPGTNVKVKLLSPLDSTLRTVKIRRERISIPSIPYAGMLTDSVAYINHSDFTEGCSDEMRMQLKRLEAEGMRSLILDYRGNGGGIMQEAIKVLSLFLPRGSEVLKVKSRADSTIYRTSGEPLFADMNIVALIDGSSASAAEIVVGALQDMDRAILVGRKSFGKGLVQSTIPVGFDSYLKLTTARYYIPSGRCIQAIDYTDHSDNREAVVVADSLRREFRTAGGRVVYDGGGITPDIKIPSEYVSRFASTLYAFGHIEDWGESYFKRHHTEQIDIRTFALTDDDFADFVNFVKDRDINYESRASKALKELESAAKADRNSELLDSVKRLKGELHDDTQSNLERYKSEIMRYMKQDIILRYAYSQGVLENSLQSDKDVQRALKLLSTPAKLQSLLNE